MATPKAKKPSVKQQIRSILSQVNKLEKKYAAARDKAAVASCAKDAAWKELDAARVKVARLSCPFKQGQILKHAYKPSYVKVTLVEDAIGGFKPPYFRMEGKRVKADHKTYIDKEAKQLDPSDWEPLPKVDDKAKA